MGYNNKGGSQQGRTSSIDENTPLLLPPEDLIDSTFSSTINPDSDYDNDESFIRRIGEPESQDDDTSPENFDAGFNKTPYFVLSVLVVGKLLQIRQRT